MQLHKYQTGRIIFHYFQKFNYVYAIINRGNFKSLDIPLDTTDKGSNIYKFNVGVIWNSLNHQHIYI